MVTFRNAVSAVAGSRALLARTAGVAALALVLLAGAAYAGTRLMAANDRPGGDRAAAAAAETPAAVDPPAGDAPAGDAPAADPSAEPSGTPAPGATQPAPPTGGAAPPTKPAAKPPAAPAGPVGEVLTLVNAERAKAGCPAVTAERRLATAAQAHTVDMARNKYFSHTGRDGSSLANRIDRTGYRWSTIGENIAKGQPTPVAVMKAWMNSPGHRANILNCRFSQLGVGLAFDGRTPVWTQDFARPR